MTTTFQFLACAAGLASTMGFPVTSTTSTNKISSLPHTVLFSAHQSRTRSAYSGTKVEDNGPQQQMMPPQQPYQQPPPAGPNAYNRPDPYLQQYQQLQQPQQPHQPQFQQAAYNNNYQNYQTIPGVTTVATPTQSSLPDPILPVTEDVSELPEKVGTTSYTANSKPWFEDPRGGVKPVSYQAAPVVAAPTVDLTPISQEYNPFVQAMAATAPPMDTGTRANTNNNVQQPVVPLPTQDLPLPVDMAPPLATMIPPPVPEILPPPPIQEPVPGVRKSDGLLTEEPTKAFIQGNSRRTWTSDDPYAQSSAVWLQAERPGGPLYSEVKFRNGPSSTPQSMKVYSEDGYLRPLQAYFGRPRGKNRATSQTIDVMNTASMEFPISATISQSRDFGTHGNSFQGDMDWKRIQGKNAIRTYSQDDKTEFVRINLETDGLPLMANIEVLQGPGDVRQVIELRSDDGSPWEGIVAVPGTGASVIVRNVGPLEFPIRCSVENHGWD